MPVTVLLQQDDSVLATIVDIYEKRAASTRKQRRRA
jgi:hypothetical protein